MFHEATSLVCAPCHQTRTHPVLRCFFSLPLPIIRNVSAPGEVL